MIAFRLMAGAVAAGVLSFSAVQAATIINRDTSAHTLRVVEGDQEKTIRAEPSQRLDGLCASSCSLYFDDDPEAYDIAAGDIVSIEDGQLFFEDPELEPDPPTQPDGESKADQ